MQYATVLFIILVLNFSLPGMMLLDPFLMLSADTGNEVVSLKRICTAKPTLDDVFLKYAGAIHLKGKKVEEKLSSKAVQA